MSKNNKLNELSIKLLAHRKRLNLTQQEVADMLHISMTTYGGIERGTYALNLRLITQIAQFLGITLAEAFQLYYNQK